MAQEQPDLELDADQLDQRRDRYFQAWVQMAGGPISGLMLAGFDGFWNDAKRRRCALPEADYERGWHMAEAQCFAEGWAAGAGNGEENRYPQFSPMWEAWGDGFNQALVLRDVKVGP